MDNQEKDISLVEEYNQQGRVLYKVHFLEREKNFAEAEKLLDDSFFEAPDSAEYAKLKVQLLLQQEKIEEAAIVAEKALNSTFDEELNFYLANIYFSTEQYRKAAESTQRTVNSCSVSSDEHYQEVLHG